MSTTNSLALHEILLSIADGLNEAQKKLRSLPQYDEYGRPNTLYQLPYLDFSLEVISEFASQTENTQNSNDDNNSEIPNPALPPAPTPSPTPTPIDPKVIDKETEVAFLDRGATDFKQKSAFLPKLQNTSLQNISVAKTNLVTFAPVSNSGSQSSQNSSSNSSKITSTISGRFVAIMPNEGLPQVFIECVATKVEEGSTIYQIEAKLRYADGNPVTGQRVEINFDPITSENINQIELTVNPQFQLLKDGFTNNNGAFVTQVLLNENDYNSNKTFVFVANSANIYTSIAISK
jgi:biotin carboxyl carrier protein